MGFDRTTEVAGLMNHLWLTLFSRADLKEQLGLKYISHTMDDYSSWYLWLDECRGVYKLELQGAQTIEGYDWLAEFVIKYYPSREEEVYRTLSILERMCRDSKVFHNHPAEGPPSCACHGHSSETDDNRFKDLSQGTGIPSCRYKTDIPTDFFYAGDLVLAFKDHVGSLVKLKSQTSWHITMTEDYEVLDSEGNSRAILHKGEVDRDYPGFTISHLLYDNFVKSLALFHGYTVKEMAVCKGQGIRFYSDGTSLTTEGTPNIQRIIVQAELRYQPEERLVPLLDEDLADLYQT